MQDGGNSLTVDAPVGTPVFVRLSDGAAAITTLPVSLASAPLPTNAAIETGGNLATLVAATKLEDAVHTDGDRGAFVLAIRNDQIVTSTTDDKEYTAFTTDKFGRLWVNSDVLRDIGQAQLDAQQIQIAQQSRELSFLSTQSGGFVPIPERIFF